MTDTPATEPVESNLPKDLADKWGAVEAAATTANILQKGHYPYSFSKAVGASIAFMVKLHEQCVEDVLKHPDAHLIPELKKIIKAEVKRSGKKAKKSN